MARRVSRPASAPNSSKTANGKLPKKKAKRSGIRSLNAFAIASAEQPYDTKVRSSRLGQRDDSPASRKRRRQAQDEDDSEDGEDSEIEERQSRKRRAKEKLANGEEDYSEGSDSEGNTWRVGHVDKDDDSEIDSDEAFGSEEEEELAFGKSGQKKNGETTVHKRNGKAVKNESIDLDESNSDLTEGSDDESLGEDAVDLAQMLDDYEPSEDEAVEDSKARQKLSSGEESSSEEDEDSHFSGFSEEDEDEEEASMKNSQLQDLISSLHPKSKGSSTKTAQLYESTAPTAAGPTAKEKFDINSLLNSTSDPSLASLIKKVGNVPKELKKDPKLSPSLPKLKKDQLDRIAASNLAEKTLNRWVDSVKHMRRAEHLTFPLQNPDNAPPPGGEHTLPVITTAPLNNLESTINNILLESGLAPNEDEDEKPGFDELPENKISLKEVLERRAELRRARELMFQEERRAKRIKKIKSKSYRRVHRKERERRMAAMGDDDDSDMDDEDREAHDRRRAEERMGAKHKDSKWAKQMKKAGRTVWDDDARSGVAEMAIRNEELRKRIAGKTVHDEDEDSSSSEDESADEKFKLRQLNGKLDNLLVEDEKETGLSSLKFMKKAEQARKAENDATIRRMKKALAGEESSEPESEDDNLGRKLFGPQAGKTNTTLFKEVRNEFEELNSDEENAVDDIKPVVDPSYRPIQGGKHAKSEAKNTKASDKAISKSISKPLDLDLLPGEIHSAPNTDGWVTVSYDKNDDQDENDNHSEISQSEILRRAFAGDEFEEQFEKEKASIVKEEDEQVIDNSLEGWGSWVGDGISRREKNRARAIKAQSKQKFVTKIAGIRPQDRKDAKMKNVMISQKRVKNNAAFLAPTLPFPFKTKAEYEKSIRMPVGGDWNVAKSVQENTKPRVIVKPGRVVEPMTAPIV